MKFFNILIKNQIKYAPQYIVLGLWIIGTIIFSIFATVAYKWDEETTISLIWIGQFIIQILFSTLITIFSMINLFAGTRFESHHLLEVRKGFSKKQIFFNRIFVDRIIFFIFWFIQVALYLIISSTKTSNDFEWRISLHMNLFLFVFLFNLFATFITLVFINFQKIILMILMPLTLSFAMISMPFISKSIITTTGEITESNNPQKLKKSSIAKSFFSDDASYFNYMVGKFYNNAFKENVEYWNKTNNRDEYLFSEFLVACENDINCFEKEEYKDLYFWKIFKEIFDQLENQTEDKNVTELNSFESFWGPALVRTNLFKILSRFDNVKLSGETRKLIDAIIISTPNINLLNSETRELPMYSPGLGTSKLYGDLRDWSVHKFLNKDNYRKWADYLYITKIIKWFYEQTFTKIKEDSFNWSSFANYKYMFGEKFESDAIYQRNFNPIFAVVGLLNGESWRNDSKHFDYLFAKNMHIGLMNVEGYMYVKDNEIDKLVAEIRELPEEKEKNINIYDYVHFREGRKTSNYALTYIINLLLDAALIYSTYFIYKKKRFI